MPSRNCADSDLMRRALRTTLFCSLVASGCSVFEEPLSVEPDASPTEDASAPLLSSPEDAAVTAVEDAMVDASAVVATPIPKRPALRKCGFAKPVNKGTVDAPALDEISGIAVSRRNARIVWAIEDSGNGATVHAINDQGRLVATYTVAGAAVDYEDIAVGPGPNAGESYLYIADIGDNNGMRSSIAVYRAPEPQVNWNQTFVVEALQAVAPLPMKYPSGAHNAEALMIDPETQDLYVITKDGYKEPNTVYALTAPHTPTVLRTLEKLAPVYAGEGTDIAVTGADISADGKHVVIRSLRSLNHWTRAPGMSIVETIQNTEPCDAELAPDEVKGESVSFASDGYYTISEGASEVLHFVGYQLP